MQHDSEPTFSGFLHYASVSRWAGSFGYGRNDNLATFRKWDDGCQKMGQWFLLHDWVLDNNDIMTE
jgi:hypothetical protein